MIETRHDHEYQARVWMQRTLAGQIRREALARIEAMLPGGYTYRIEKGPDGWGGSFGENGYTWMIPHRFRTEAGATLGLLALMCDECVFPGCHTSYGSVQLAAQERHRSDT